MWNHTIRVDSIAASMLFHSSLFSFCCAFPSILIVDTDYKLCETQKAMLLSRVSLPPELSGRRRRNCQIAQVGDLGSISLSCQCPVACVQSQLPMYNVLCPVSNVLCPVSSQCPMAAHFRALTNNFPNFSSRLFVPGNFRPITPKDQCCSCEI